MKMRMRMGAKSDATKRAMANAFVELSKEKPSAKISVREVTQRVGVDRQTFYYHFDTMDDLVSFSCRQLLESMLDDFDEGKNVHDIVSHVLARVEAARNTIVPFLHGIGRETMKGVLYGEVHAIFEKAARLVDGVERGNLSEREFDFAVSYIQYASVSIIVEWLSGRVDMSSEELSDYLTRAIEREMNS